MTNAPDYGPLTGLIGTWKGDRGLDIAPDPEGREENPYYETIVFDPVGEVTNADSQHLVALHYLQIVQRKADDGVFHHQSGYWMWDAEGQTLMQSITIPRGVCVLAGGRWDGERDDEGNLLIEVSAELEGSGWGLVQSPFMNAQARTTAFVHRLHLGQDHLRYREITRLEIYRGRFEHEDANELVRV